MDRGKKRLQTLKNRRYKAVELFEKGERQASIARILGVSRQSVSRWYRDWFNGDREALCGSTQAGRKRRLAQDQPQLIEEELLRGARAHSYPSDLWTLPRVARLIEEITGVHYHPGHVWRVLRQMGWSLQRPTLQARERDEQKVRQWKTRTWARVKKTPKSGGPG